MAAARRNDLTARHDGTAARGAGIEMVRAGRRSADRRYPDLATGAVALYLGFAGSSGAVRTFCLVFGAVYLALGVLGFVAPGVVAAVIGHPARGRR